MSIEDALKKMLDEQDKANGIRRIPAPRDFVPCSWCGGSSALIGGKGCAACFNAREKKKHDLDEEYNRQFPDGPKPIFECKIDTPEGIEKARRVIGREAIEKAFGPGGGGMEEVMANIEREKRK